MEDKDDCMKKKEGLATLTNTTAITTKAVQQENADHVPLSTVMVGKIQGTDKLHAPLLCLFDFGSATTWFIWQALPKGISGTW